MIKFVMWILLFLQSHDYWAAHNLMSVFLVSRVSAQKFIHYFKCESKQSWENQLMVPISCLKLREYMQTNDV